MGDNNVDKVGIKKLQISNYVMGREGVYVETFVMYEEKIWGKVQLGDGGAARGWGW